MNRLKQYSLLLLSAFAISSSSFASIVDMNHMVFSFSEGTTPQNITLRIHCENYEGEPCCKCPETQTHQFANNANYRVDVTQLHEVMVYYKNFKCVHTSPQTAENLNIDIFLHLTEDKVDSCSATF